MAASKVNSPYKAVMDTLNAYLLEHEMRMTPVRAIILNELCQLPQPFTESQLEEACRNERISRATIYNTLNLLMKIGALHTLERQRGRTVTEYEITKEEVNRMQIVCTKCGRVTEFHEKAIARLMKEKKFVNFNIRHFRLTVFGECKACVRSRKRLGKK